MKKIIVETKHGGKVSVPMFDSLADAIQVLTEKTVLRNFNRMVRIDMVNEANRKQSLTAKLKAAVKAGKVTEDQLLALLK